MFFTFENFKRAFLVGISIVVVVIVVVIVVADLVPNERRMMQKAKS
jgi:flagellar biosynthesis protein FliP